MTFEELHSANAIVEIDDVHAAHVIVDETMHMAKQHRMYRTAKLLAVLREHYVNVGMEMATTPSPLTKCSLD